MIFASHQPCLLPHPGYWWKMKHADVWAHNDAVEFSRRAFQHRVQCGLGESSHWFTLPVCRHDHLRVGEVWISEPNPRKLVAQLDALHRGTRYWPTVRTEILDVIAAIRHETRLVDVTVPLVDLMRRVLRIDTPVIEIDWLPGCATTKIIGRTALAGCDTYLAGPRARDYLDLALLAEAGIEVEHAQPVPDGPYRGRSILTAYCHEGPSCLEVVYGA